MRYLWIGGLIALVLFGTSCGGSTTPTTRSTVVHHRRHVPTTTTIPRKRTKTTHPVLPSGIWDKASSASLIDIERAKGMGHAKIAKAFRTVFWELSNAENTDLHHDGHIAAGALLRDDVYLLRLAFDKIFQICNEMR